MNSVATIYGKGCRIEWNEGMSIMAGAPEHIEASLNYSVDRKFSRVVSIYDGRAILGQLSLEKQGFVLTRRETAIRDFYDAAEVRSIYYPEVEQLLKDMTGAAKVLALEHDVRCLPASKRGQKGVREPVRVVHDDYTEKSAPERVRLYLPEEAEGLLKSRFAVINVWRPIAGPVLDTPLAVCDAQSLAEHDLIPTEEMSNMRFTCSASARTTVGITFLICRGTRHCSSNASIQPAMAARGLPPILPLMISRRPPTL